MRFAPQTQAALAGLGLTALAAAPAQAQGLNGQPLTVTYRNPTILSIAPNGGTQTITPAGAMFTFAGVSVFVTPTQIQFTGTPGFPSTTFGSAAFNGFGFTETGGSPTPITGFLVDPATNVPGFNLSRVSGDPTDIFANFQGLTINPGQNVTIDIFTAPPAVPEASTTVSFGLLLALGLGGMVVAARKRKRA